MLCTATDVGIYGLLASQSCYHSMLAPCWFIHCGPVADFFIPIHPFDFVRNLFIFFIIPIGDDVSDHVIIILY